jgi:hypothetical protein
MKAVALVLVVLLAIGAIVGVMYVDRKNQMVTKNETVKSTWAEVDVVLRRRAFRFNRRWISASENRRKWSIG